jgi:hypothetical protein
VADGLAADVGGSERAPTLALLAARVDAAALRDHRRAATQAAEAAAAQAEGSQVSGFLADTLTRPAARRRSSRAIRPVCGAWCRTRPEFRTRR